MTSPAVRVILWRGDVPESEHRVRVAVWRKGALERTAGDVDAPVFLRSAAKPFQALASVVTGAADTFSMSEAELALACGSHGGEPFHTATAAGLLTRLGLGPDALLCGAHWPNHEPAARDLVRAGEEPSNLHNNCSGKHSNMLAACVAMGWPVEEYVAFGHALQRLNRDHMAAFAGVRPDEVHLGVDGCSAPNFAVPLAASARAIALWTNPAAAAAGEHAIPGPAREAAERIRGALAEHPEMIGGTRRVDTDLIRMTAGRVIAKMGAEGVWLIGLAGDETGIALKAEDGAGRAVYPVGLSLLRALGALSDAHWEALSHYHDPVLRNHRRLAVGRVEIRFPWGT